MASSDLVDTLDRALMDAGIIDPLYSGEYRSVHDEVAVFLSDAGQHISVKTLKKGEAHLGQWLRKQVTAGASIKRVNSYLRSGLAHLCLDFTEYTYDSIFSDTEDLIEKAISSFKNRGYHTAQYQEKALKKKASASKSPAKKTGTKKAAKKTASKKTAKKSAAGSTKKKAAKKTVKKSAAKPEKKKAVKKTAGTGMKKKPASSQDFISRLLDS